MTVKIYPSKASGTVQAPPSKSMAHRLLICAALSKGESVIHHISESQDIAATVDCLRTLGADIRIKRENAYINGIENIHAVTPSKPLFCRESGSTLRFLIPLCLLSGKRTQLFGKKRLMERPLSVYEEICARQGIVFEKHEDSLTVEGRLRPGVYEIPGDISSQFISGLLFILPLLDGDSEIRLLPPVESRPYIDMTVEAMRSFGVCVDARENTLYIKGKQNYSNKELTVEGDYSNAAFFEALNVLGGEVTVTGLREDSLQGDRVYKILYEKIKSGESPIDISDCPDLGPILFTLAAYCGGCEFVGTRRLGIKESDRALTMKEELSKFGAQMEIEENRVSVKPSALCAPKVPLNSHNDHRVAMSLAVLSVKYGAEIHNAQAVEKSFPDFFDRLKDLGVELKNEMDH